MSDRPKSKQVELFSKALQYKKEQNFTLAKDCFEELAKLNQFNYYAISNLGLCYRLIGDYENALEKLTKSLSIKKNDEFTEINQAIVYFELKDYEKAKSILNSYLTVNKKNYVLHYYLANCYRETNDQDQNIFDMYEKAISLFYDSKSKYFYGINLSDIYLDMAIAYLKKKQFHDCEDILTNKKLDLQKDYLYYKIYGTLLYNTKKYQKALEAFKSAKDIKITNPSSIPGDIKNYECWFNYALCLYELGNFEECKKELDSIIKIIGEKENIFPFSTKQTNSQENAAISKLEIIVDKSKYLQGKMLYRENKLEEAKKIFEEIDACNLKDTPKEIFYFLGNIYFKEFKFRTALDYYESISEKDLSLNANLQYLYNNIGLCHIQLGNIKSASEYFEKSVNKDSKNGISLISKGNCMALKKDDKTNVMNCMDPYRYADEIYQRKNKLVFYNKGLAQYKFKKYKEAIGTLNRAILLDDKYFDAYLNRGNCYIKIEEFKNAFIDYQKCISLFKEFTENEANQSKEEAKFINEKILMVYANIISNYDNLKDENVEGLEDIQIYKEKLNEFDEDIPKDPNDPNAPINPKTLATYNEEGLATFKNKVYYFLNKDNLNYIQSVVFALKNKENK